MLLMISSMEEEPEAPREKGLPRSASGSGHSGARSPQAATPAPWMPG